ncbi:putative S-adenosyl-L-methionine-dependent methyltransferase [subsurface metagenome]
MKAIQTGFGVSWVRATGTLYPKEKRLFEDPYSEKMLSPFLKFFIFLQRSPKINDAIVRSKEKSTPGIMGWLFCRFRYIDDVLKDSIAKKEIETVVNLGAGMDCRAYYIPGIKSVRYFEVDHPSVIEQKKAKMEKILGKLPEHVIFVPVDFEKQSLDTELKKAGYNLTSKTLFIWEGVTQYISKEANDSALKYVAQAAPGSKIVFTYILKSFIEGKNIHDGIKVMYKYMRKKDNPLWIFGLDPSDMENYLSKYSLSLIEDIGSEEMEERYMKLVDLDLSVFEIERMALAEVKRGK